MNDHPNKNLFIYLFKCGTCTFIKYFKKITFKYRLLESIVNENVLNNDRKSIKIKRKLGVDMLIKNNSVRIFGVAINIVWPIAYL